MTAIERFVTAFGEADRDAMAAEVAPDATATLVGADGIAPEQGPAAMRKGSFAHLLDGPPLDARIVEQSPPLVVLTHREDGAIDGAIALTLANEKIAAIRYHTLWNDRAFVESLATRLGLAVPEEPQ